MVAVLSAALLWGLGGTLAKVFMQSVPPGVLIPLRFVLSFAILAPVLIRNRPRGEAGRLVLVGLALAGAQAFYYLAIDATTVATGIFLQYLAPALLTVYALSQGERILPRAFAGVALALFGAYVLVAGQVGLSINPLGIGYGLLAAFSFAAYAQLSSRLKSPPLVALAVATGVGALFSAPWLILNQGPLRSLGLADWSGVLYLVTLGTVLPFALFLYGVRQLRPRVATLLAMLEPVAGALFAVPLAHEPITLWTTLGGGLILLGVWLNTERR